MKIQFLISNLMSGNYNGVYIGEVAYRIENYLTGHLLNMCEAGQKRGEKVFFFNLN